MVHFAKAVTALVLVLFSPVLADCHNADCGPGDETNLLQIQQEVLQQGTRKGGKGPGEIADKVEAEAKKDGSKMQKQVDEDVSKLEKQATKDGQKEAAGKDDTGKKERQEGRDAKKEENQAGRDADKDKKQSDKTKAAEEKEGVNPADVKAKLEHDLKDKSSAVRGSAGLIVGEGGKHADKKKIEKAMKTKTKEDLKVDGAAGGHGDPSQHDAHKDAKQIASKLKGKRGKRGGGSRRGRRGRSPGDVFTSMMKRTKSRLTKKFKNRIRFADRMHTRTQKNENSASRKYDQITRKADTQMTADDKKVERSLNRHDQFVQRQMDRKQQADQNSQRRMYRAAKRMDARNMGLSAGRQQAQIAAGQAESKMLAKWSKNDRMENRKAINKWKRKMVREQRRYMRKKARDQSTSDNAMVRNYRKQMNQMTANSRQDTRQLQEDIRTPEALMRLDMGGTGKRARRGKRGKRGKKARKIAKKVEGEAKRDGSKMTKQVEKDVVKMEKQATKDGQKEAAGKDDTGKKERQEGRDAAKEDKQAGKDAKKDVEQADKTKDAEAAAQVNPGDVKAKLAHDLKDESAAVRGSAGLIVGNGDKDADKAKVEDAMKAKVKEEVKVDGAAGGHGEPSQKDAHKDVKEMEQR